MADISVALTLDNKQYTTAIKESEQATKDFGRSAEKSADQAQSGFGKMTNSVNTLLDKMRGLKSAIIMGGLLALGKSAVQASGEIFDLANATGIAAENIKAFQSAAMLAGASVEGSNNAIGLFVTKIDEAASSSLKLRQQFASVGVTLQDLANLSEQDIFRKTIEGLAKMPESAAKTALQGELLGKSFRGVAINQEFLDNLDAGEEKARKLVEQMRRADELGDRWDKAMMTIKMSFLEAFGPMLGGIAKLLEMVPNLTKAFQALGIVIAGVLVATGLRTFVTLLGAGLRAVQGIAKGFQTITRNRAGNIVTKPMTTSEKVGAVGAAAGLAGGVATVAGLGGIAVSGFGEEPPKPEVPKVEQAGPKRDVPNLLKGREKSITDIADAYTKANAEQLKSIQLDAELIGTSRVYQETRKAEADIEKRAADAIDKLLTQKENLKEEEKGLAGQIDRQIAAIKGSVEADKEKARSAISLKDATRLNDEVQQKFRDRLVETKKALSDLKFDTATIGLSEYEKRTRQAEKASMDWADTTIRDLARSAGVSEESYKKMYADKVAETYKKARENLAEYNKEIEANIQKTITQGNLNYGIQERTRFMEEERNLLNEINNRDMPELEKRLFAVDEAARKSAQNRIREVDSIRFSTEQLAQGYSIANQEAAKGGDPALVKNIEESSRQGRDRIRELTTSSYESSRTFNQGWKDAFRTYVDDLGNTAKQAKSYFDIMSKGIEDALVRFVRTGKLSFKDLANNMIAEFVRMEAKAAVAKIFPQQGGGIFDIIKGIGGSLFGGIFGGRAAGGPVSGGKPYMVGERGAELFVPGTDGSIVPNSALGTQAQQNINYVTYSIQALDAMSFKQMLSRDPEFLFNVTEQGRRSLPVRSRR